VTHIRYAAFPDLSEGADRVHPYVTGSPQAIAAELRSYEEDGVAHVMFDLIPNSREALARLAEALKVYRSERRREERTCARHEQRR
jgi:alkanesulfonate monooxygenase SsuD/methylene tetrahydromethanopterin reductase-like flavin-dependent oxidoreductase (luciferase family)